MERKRISTQRMGEELSASGEQDGFQKSEEAGTATGGKKMRMTRLTFTVYRFHINRDDRRNGPDAAGCLVKPKR